MMEKRRKEKKEEKVFIENMWSRNVFKKFDEDEIFDEHLFYFMKFLLQNFSKFCL
jgi:hypothetical protein